MFLRWLAAILILPGSALVVIPAIILGLSRGGHWADHFCGPQTWLFWPAAVLAGLGLFLGTWTCTLFFRVGHGTAAPWDPPKHFVVRGPYRHVRNPMITGAMLGLLSETLFLQSGAILVWLLMFMTANLIYIPFSEEPKLAQRFGEEYLAYKRNVPRWIPRLTAWKG